MSRSYVVNGQTLVLVKGRSDSAIGTLSELGLTTDQIRITPVFRHSDITVNAWGEAPPEVQFKLAEVRISMTLVYYDNAVLQTCLQESMAGAPDFGALPMAGALMGNNLPRFAPGGANGNHYIGLNLTSPVAGLPWRFLTAYLTNPPVDIPIGTDRTAIVCNWRAIPYTIDPWNNGLGSYGSYIFDRTLDS